MLLNFVDKSFNIKKISHYRISIQITLNGFSFCVFDTSLSKHVVLRDFQYKKNVLNYDDLDRELSVIFTEDEILRQHYPLCFCIFISSKTTIIPAPLFDKNKLRAYLEFATPLDELDEIHYHKIDAYDAYSVSAFPSILVSKLNGLYHKVYYYSQSFPFIVNKKNIHGDNYCRLDLHEGMMDVILFKNGNLLLQNRFDIKHLNDAVFYLMAVLNQFAINSTSYPVYVSGDILEEEITELKKYFPLLNVEYEHRMAKLLGYENSYRYFNLLKVHECE